MASRVLYTLFLFFVTATLFVLSLSARVLSTEDLETIVANIRGGEEAPKNCFQWICSIRRTDAAWKGEHWCTGFLIHPRIILTAAHCMESGYTYNYKCGGWSRLGSFVGTYEGTFENHPNFVAHEDEPEGDDISVITLTQSSSITVPIVARDMAAIDAGEQVCIAGWGYTDDQEKLAANLKILRHLKKTACLPPIGEEFCVYNADGVTMQGDSGAPAFIEGTDNGADTVYGLHARGWGRLKTMLWETPIAPYFDTFIVPKVRAVENEIIKGLPDLGCPSHPGIVSRTGLTAESKNCTVTFLARNAVAKRQALVTFGSITRANAELRFDIQITDFVQPGSDMTRTGFFLMTFDTFELHIDRDGNAARWEYVDLNSKRHDVGTSKIIPGNGVHKVRMVLFPSGIVVYEDGMKLGTVQLTQTARRESAWFGMYSFIQSLTCTVYLTNIRFDPLP